MFRSPEVPRPDAPDHQTRLIDAFVDDTTSLAITDTMSPMTPDMMTATMESILFYSGGAFNLKKVFMEHATVGMEAWSSDTISTTGGRRRY